MAFSGLRIYLAEVDERGRRVLTVQNETKLILDKALGVIWKRERTMKPSFDVLQEPWIPVVTFEGKPSRWGILDAPLRSPDWKEIQDPSPMVEYSVYRFLIVFLMDALRPETPVDLEELLYAGQFDESAIQDYITLCHSEGVSFDLFDPNRPFMQTSVDKKTGISGANRSQPSTTRFPTGTTTSTLIIAASMRYTSREKLCGCC